MVILGLHMYRPTIYSLKGAKMRLGEGSSPPNGSTSENIEFEGYKAFC